MRNHDFLLRLYKVKGSEEGFGLRIKGSGDRHLVTASDEVLGPSKSVVGVSWQYVCFPADSKLLGEMVLPFYTSTSAPNHPQNDA